MKRYPLAVLAFAAAMAVLPALASASLPVNARIPQETISGTDLQVFFDNVPQTINVGTDQEHAQRWKCNISGGLTGMTLQIEMSLNSATHEIGVYNADDPSPVPASLFAVFPGSALPGWYALAKFRADGRLVVTLFDQDSNFQGTTTHEGVNTQDFGYYIRQSPGGPTFYTQDWRQAGTNSPQALVFTATDGNAGGFWLCFEDSKPGDPGSDRDFDDAVVFLEAVNPTPVARTSWGALKSQFR